MPIKSPTPPAKKLDKPPGFGLSFVVQEIPVPMWASGLAVVFMGFLAYEGLRLYKESRSGP